MIYDSEALITEIRDIAGLPKNEVPGYKKADLLRHASAVLRSRLLPLLVKAREEYCIQKARIAIVQGCTEYRIPPRALGDRLRQIFWVDSNGARKRIEIIPPTELHRYQPYSQVIQGIYLTATHIVTVGQAPGGWLEVWFPFRVGDLVLASDARQVTGVDAGTKTITFATVIPAIWQVGTKLDIHSRLGGHDLKMWAEPIAVLPQPSGGPPPPPPAPQLTLVTTNAIDGSAFGTFPLEVGDWVCLEQQSALVGIPEELVPALARGVALRIAEGDHDTEAMQHHQAELAADLENAIPLVKQRIQAKCVPIKGRRSCLFGG